MPVDCKDYAIRIGDKYEVYAHALYTRLTDRHGFASKRGTKKFLKWADEFNPDLVWLHNIHGYYINIELLFKWLKARNITNPQMEVRWTLHDCWAMTGHCAYFTEVNCNKWKNEEGCSNCPQKRQYPGSVIDNCKKNYCDKKKLFTGINNVKLITPSKWLAEIVKESYLKEYPAVVVNNSVDVKIFRKLDKDDKGLIELKKKYVKNDKKLLLAVSNVWDRRKGLDDLIELSCMVSEKYKTIIIGLGKKQITQIPKTVERCYKEILKEIESSKDGNSIDVNSVLLKNKNGVATKTGALNLYRGLLDVVGDDDEVKKGVCSTENGRSMVHESIELTFTPDIITIPRTESQEELVRFYNLADVFINPTHEDNYPTVNLEAIACGTKVLTTDAGGSGETLWTHELSDREEEAI